MPNHWPAQAHVKAALRAQATRTAGDLIKDLARAYAKRPRTLENVFPGLSAAAPETMIGVAKHLITEKNAPRRWFGLGGEIPILNAKAVLLSARALRRDEGRQARQRPQELCLEPKLSLASARRALQTY